ncbi:unnamed protein product [Aspergillus oryzae RIB40]|uniref:DNA, SC012 n=1 Tax=Aspergillus oryzae (strain ATCC 42149 / RIB 40) TaxID=510516 RepID=Q2UCX7_ASPOR|nr:unnamed protein product [Aspergillus oryzae RIB40]BAE60588.1 unnamed protein product [Aspergillus oryzae RIB40]
MSFCFWDLRSTSPAHGSFELAMGNQRAGPAEMEFFQRDFEVMSFFTSCHSDCFLTSHLLVVKYLREGDEVYGKIVLDDDKIKKNDGGKNVLLQTCMTERARVEALKDQFGIELTEEEQNGIQGRMSALATSDS